MIKNGPPNADEIDFSFNGESVLKCVGLLPAIIGLVNKHLVGEWHLLMVTGWENADLTKEIINEWKSKNIERENIPYGSYQPVRGRYTRRGRTQR